jgi:hypothetical protein
MKQAVMFMFLEKLFTKTTREAPSAPVREPFIAPTVLPACCACGLVQDKAGATPDLERWVTPQTYREAHGVNPAELDLTHTYCPRCFAKVQETVQQFFRKTGSAPTPVRKAPAPWQQPTGPAAQIPPGQPISPCDALHDLIATRAYELCRERGYGNRFALNAWLDAEREILRQIPPV